MPHAEGGTKRQASPYHCEGALQSSSAGIALRHDGDTQRFDAAPVPRKIGGIVGSHRHRWCLLLQALDDDLEPSSAQDIQHVLPIHAVVRDQHQCRAVATGHASEAHVTPSRPVPGGPVPDIAQTAPQPPDAIA